MNKKVKLIIGIILLLIIASAICSCKTTKYVTVPEYHSDTVRVSSHDTIIVKQHSESVSVPLPTVYLSNVTKDTVLHRMGSYTYNMYIYNKVAD